MKHAWLNADLLQALQEETMSSGFSADEFFDINQPSLPTPFYSVLVSVSVFIALSTVSHP